MAWCLEVTGASGFIIMPLVVLISHNSYCRIIHTGACSINKRTPACNIC